MSTPDVDRLRSIKTFPSLVKYLRDELDWPIDSESFDELTFEYQPEELGLDPKKVVGIKEIRQLRPLTSGQPWGIFWINFEKKRMPMTVMRRILGNLVTKSRTRANKAHQPTWRLHDLLFVSSYGEEEHRHLAFAHFSEVPNTDELPVLRVLGWDDQNSIMHLDRVANRLGGHLRWPANSDDIEAWRRHWSEAFTDRHREAIRSADVLIPRLAHLAANIRKRVSETLEHESERGPMRKLFAAVRKLLIHDMSEDRFADMYAQTVSYGLLSTSFSRLADITPQNLVQLTAISNPFLENLLENLFRLNRGRFHFDVDEVGINDVLDLLRNTNIEAIKAAFSDKNPAEDPVIRFYEGFLKEYDPDQRIKRGVFFTPRPVVSYIVRTVHELLQTKFGLEDGLASTVTWADMLEKFPDLKLPKDTKPSDPFISVLDPAVGTGTFLYTCIEVIELTMKDKWCRELRKKQRNDPEILARWGDYVPRHLLPRLYGFELMMAPYAIAHLKLALKLGETGYQFRGGDRLRIYLTNSLEPPSDVADSKLADLFATLAKEAQEVNDIKREKRFTIVIGNPPYSLWSQNLTETARAIVDPYRSVNGDPIKERGALQFEKILQDDYVKFFRLSQAQIDNSRCGILGLITNHAFIDNPTLRGMRCSLLNSFHHIFCLNLHGNSSKKERSPDGSADVNVFDIKQGVAIFHGLQLPLTNSELRLYADLWGTRESKYATLADSSLVSVSHRDFVPTAPFFLFKARDSGFADEYDQGWKLTDVFPQGSMGVVTARDHVSISFEDDPLLRTATEFRNSRLSDEAVCQKLDIPEKKGWDAAKARALIKQEKNLKSFIKPIDYRPFDSRKIFYHRSLVWGMSWPTMRHVLDKDNIGISTTRSIETGPFQHVFTSCRLIGHHFVSLKEVNYFFPLWLYPETDSLAFPGHRTPNLKPEFARAVALCLGLRPSGPSSLPQGVRPEDIFHYVYAVFHSPAYRSRYAEFLKTDFPRLPLTSSVEMFRALATLGAELVTLHLMESPKLNKHITKFVGDPKQEIEKIFYADKTVWIDKAQTTGFPGVPEHVWNFHVGGYQVCEKWLKDRKGRTLSKEDIEHYQRIAVALNETIRLMAEIDKVIEAHGGWPAAFATSMEKAQR